MPTLHPSTASTAEAFEQRGTRSAVWFDADEALLSPLRRCTPFLDWQAEAQGSFSISGVAWLRATCCGFVLGNDTLDCDPATCSPHPEEVGTIMMVHFENGLTPGACKTLGEWLERLHLSTTTLLKGEHADSLKVICEGGLFQHEALTEAESNDLPGWMGKLTHNLLCDERQIPVAHNLFYALVDGATWSKVTRLAPAGRYQQGMRMVRSLLAEYVPAVKNGLVEQHSFSAAKYVGRFLRDLPTLWQDGDTGGGSEGITDMMPAMTVVDDWLSEKAIMLYGQPEQVRRLIAQRFADIISMRRVVVCTVPGARQGAGEPGAQLGDEQAEGAAQPGWTFTYRFPYTQQFFATASLSERSETLHMHFSRLASETSAQALTIEAQLSAVESLLRRHAVELSKVVHQDKDLQDLVEVALLQERESMSLLTQGTAQAGTGTLASSTGAGEGAYNASVTRSVEACLRETCFAEHGDRIVFLKGDEMDPMWQLKVCMEAVVPDATFTLDAERGQLWGQMDEGRHSLLTQMLYGERKLTAKHHEACAILMEVRSQREKMISLFCLHEDDMGEGDDSVERKRFMLPERFFKASPSYHSHLVNVVSHAADDTSQ